MTLALSNVAALPVKLRPGMKIGQLRLFRCSSPAEHPHGSPVYGVQIPGPARAHAVTFPPDLLPRQVLTGRGRQPYCLTGRTAANSGTAYFAGTQASRPAAKRRTSPFLAASRNDRNTPSG